MCSNDKNGAAAAAADIVLNLKCADKMIGN